MKKIKTLFLVVILLIIPSNSYTQILDTISKKPIQYRRGLELQEGYQSYDEKYSGKNFNEEKTRLFPLQSTGVWTELNPKVPRVDYIGIDFINPDTGWAVGDLGALIKSTNGGNSWTVSETNTTTPILKVRSFNGQVVIASGFNGLILRSTDGGETFTQVPSGVMGDLWGLQMINDNLGWACGTANSLVKTTNGGLTWQIIFTPGYTTNYWWIDFLDEDYGFIAADGKVLRTTDGGDNWEIIQAGDNQALYSIDVIDSLHIAAAGFGGTGYRGKNIYSSDAGYTWINGGPLTFEAVNCIQYVNPDTGYLVMTNVSARKTTNRGQEWTTLQGISDNYDLQFIEDLSRLVGEYTGYSVGTGLQLSKAEGNLDVWNRLIINDNFADVFFVSEEKGFAISGVLSTTQALYKTTDGGINWERVPNAPSGNDLLFLDSLTGFIGSNIIYKTTDGGETWYMPNGGSGGAGKIFFVNETIGWAIRSNVIYKTTDRGENWTMLFTHSFASFTGLHFVDSQFGWVSGGRPQKTTDGGQNWIEQTSTSIWNSDDVYFQNIGTGWIGKYSSINNSLFKTTDGGLNWIAVPEIVGARKFYNFPDPIHWIIIGFSRYYITNDYGNSWLEFTDDVPTGLVSFNALTNNLGYSVGNLGLILKYDDTTYVPVEFVSFQGKSVNNTIVLKWITATELNNYGFEILRSVNLTDWEIRGFVSGNGTTTEHNFYIFQDSEFLNDHYFYKLKQIDFNGNYNFSEIIEVEIQINNYSLSQNYPNPANPKTSIAFSIPEKTIIKINLYSVTGEMIKELLNEEKEKGIYTIDVKLNGYASGMYFYRMTTNSGYTAIKKLILLK